jgi:hypothetical protein
MHTRAENKVYWLGDFHSLDSIFVPRGRFSSDDIPDERFGVPLRKEVNGIHFNVKEHSFIIYYDDAVAGSEWSGLFTPRR